MAGCKDRLHDLRASMAAIAAMGRTLDVCSEAQLCDAIARLLRNATASPCAMVLVRVDNATEVAVCKTREGWEGDAQCARQEIVRHLPQLNADGPDCLELAGLPFVVVPMSANGRYVVGALCFAVDDDASMDIAALTALAASGAGHLMRVRGAAELQRRQVEPESVSENAQGGQPGRLGDEGGMLRTIIDNMPDHIYAKDVNGRFLVGNKAAAELIFGVPDASALIGKSDLDFYPIECGQRFFTDEQQIIRTGVPIVDQIEANVNNEGVQRFFSTTKYPFCNEQGEIIGIVGISRDITARVSADEALKLRNRAVESSQDGIVITCCTTPDSPIVYTNPAFERITGFNQQEAQRSGIERFLLEAGERTDVDRAALVAHHGERRVIDATRKDGASYWCELRLAVMRNADGTATHCVFTLTDVTHARQAEQHLTLLASHDPLTGLPNRRLLMERLAHAVSVSERGGMDLAVAFLDLDGLKRVNDELGHEAGDILLRTVAERIGGGIRQSDTFARLGGDEFVLVTLHRLDQPESACGVNDVLLKLQQLIAQPIVIGAATVQATCSIGVALFRQDGARDANLPEALLKRADAAMYVAKKSGRDRIVYSAPDTAA